jgi:hypothetical protein
VTIKALSNPFEGGYIIPGQVIHYKQLFCTLYETWKDIVNCLQIRVQRKAAPIAQMDRAAVS